MSNALEVILLNGFTLILIDIKNRAERIECLGFEWSWLWWTLGVCVSTIIYQPGSVCQLVELENFLHWTLECCVSAAQRWNCYGWCLRDDPSLRWGNKQHRDWAIPILNGSLEEVARFVLFTGRYFRSIISGQD